MLENNDELERVYFPKDIQQFLGLKKSKLYDYLDEVHASKEPFKVIKIGRLYRIPKVEFDNWLVSP